MSIATPLPSVPGTPRRVTSRPTVTRSPDGNTVLDAVTVEHWAGFVRVLSRPDQTRLRMWLVQACRTYDIRLAALTATRLHEAMAEAFQTVLDDADSADLCEALDAARIPRDDCAYCPTESVDVVDGILMCAGHSKALDQSELVGGES